MPNWCENRVTISTDTAEELTEIRAFLTKDDNPFSLDAIVPMPEILHRVLAPGYRDEDGRSIMASGEPATEAEQAEIDASGATDWRIWAVDNWGTKWDTDGEHVRVDENFDTDVVYHFDTAGGPPEAAIYALRERFPDANITAFYDDL